MNILQGLKNSDFVFADRGCLVNLAHILSIRDTKIEMDNGAWIQTNRSRLAEIRRGLWNLWRKQL